MLAILGVFASDNTTRGTGVTKSSPPVAGLVSDSLASDAAHDFDPAPGDGAEHSDETPFVLDRDPNTTWSTETYTDKAMPKPGVGIYLDAKPGVEARSMRIKTTTPGWNGKVYVAKTGPPKDLAGWGTPVGSITSATRTTNVPLDTAGNTYRYYLLWIEKLPPGGERVKISELELFVPRATRR